MPDTTPLTIAKMREAGYAARLLDMFGNDCAEIGQWQLFDAAGRYLTIVMIVTGADGEETIYWLSPSIRYSDDIEQLRRLSGQAAQVAA